MAAVGPGGAARAASATSRGADAAVEAAGEHRRCRAPRGTPRAPIQLSSGSSCLAASSSSGGASLPRLSANTIWARRRVEPGALELVERARLRGRQQAPARLRRPGLELRLRRGQRPPAAPAGSGVSSAARSRNAAAAARPPRPARARPSAPARRRRPRRARRRVRAMPGAPIGIDVRDRSPRPARDAPPGGRQRAPPGRPPSAPADDGTAPGRRARSAPRPRAGAAASASDPELARPRATASVTSPTGSAAACSSSRRVSAGSDSSRRRKLCSIRLARGVASGSPNPPASSAGRQPARQLEQRERVAARLGDDAVAHPLVQRPGRAPSPAARGRRRRRALRPRSSGSPSNSRTSLGSRTANTKPTDSARRRRATNASVCAEARSSHCASSTTQTSGCSSADLGQQAEHGQTDQEAIRRRSRAAGRTPSRARRAAGRAAAPAGRASARTADAARRTRAPSRTRRPPPARRDTRTRAPTRYSSSAVLPTPASPRTTSTWL